MENPLFWLKMQMWMEIEVILGANESFLLSRLDSPSVWLCENFPWDRKKGNLSQVLNIVTINEYWRITDTHRELYIWNPITHIHSFMERKMMYIQKHSMNLQIFP